MMIDILCLTLGFILMIAGIIGSVLPVIPGTPLSWLGLIILFLSPSLPMDWLFITVTGVVAIAIYILDYIIPSIGTRKFGGSRAGAIGTFVGLIVGIFAPIPFGVLVGPFLGALVGEMAFNKTGGTRAFKAAFGSFIGFLGSTFMKLVATFIYLGLFIYQVVDNWSLFF
ncbi:DUF456 domain-containing protein [Aureitalea marina]|uniref:DUF456 domain-containing protein n=1 Tax=Aureitalea marina TaxID=930804 RepID=UPI0026817CDB